MGKVDSTDSEKTCQVKRFSLRKTQQLRLTTEEKLPPIAQPMLFSSINMKKLSSAESFCLLLLGVPKYKASPQLPRSLQSSQIPQSRAKHF